MNTRKSDYNFLGYAAGVGHRPDGLPLGMQDGVVAPDLPGLVHLGRHQTTTLQLKKEYSIKVSVFTLLSRKIALI